MDFTIDIFSPSRLLKFCSFFCLPFLLWEGRGRREGKEGDKQPNEEERREGKEKEGGRERGELMKTNRTKRRHLPPPPNPKKVLFFAVVPNMLRYVHVLYNKKEEKPSRNGA